jgi:polygalacturonase
MEKEKNRRSFIKKIAVCSLGAAVMPGGLFAKGDSSQTPAAVFYDVKLYGARGDGKAIDSNAINKTIDAAAMTGGGTVYFPAGNYLSYTIRLKSNISLFIDQGAVIIAAAPVNGVGYDAPEPNTAYSAYQDFAHAHWRTGLIRGEGLYNVSIVGQGMIWGKGLEHITDHGIKAGGGNMAIALKLCRNVTIRDVSILHGGHFGILATGVDNLTIDNLKIDTNRDGMDIDCCKNVRISNCSINSPYDDGICLKSSFGLGFARATENVTITNCQVSGYDEGSLLDGTFKRTEKKFPGGNPTGRIKMGTESNGGFKNITISNCLFDYCRGLALETVDGGLLEDVTISNITMRDISNAPLFLRLGSRMRGPAGIPVGALRRIIISNVVVYNAHQHHGVVISGIPGHDIEDIKISNVKITYRGGGTKEQGWREVPEQEKEYPEPHMFGVIPAYGFFIRHVKNIVIENVNVGVMTEDQRPAFILDHVKEAELHLLQAQITKGDPSIVLKNTDQVSIYRSFNLKDRKLDKILKMEL